MGRADTPSATRCRAMREETKTVESRHVEWMVVVQLGSLQAAMTLTVSGLGGTDQQRSCLLSGRSQIASGIISLGLAYMRPC